MEPFNRQCYHVLRLVGYYTDGVTDACWHPSTMVCDVLCAVGAEF